MNFSRIALLKKTRKTTVCLEYFVNGCRMLLRKTFTSSTLVLRLSFLYIILDMLTERWSLTEFSAKSAIDFAILSVLFSETKPFVPTGRIAPWLRLLSERQILKFQFGRRKETYVSTHFTWSTLECFVLFFSSICKNIICFCKWFVSVSDISTGKSLMRVFGCIGQSVVSAASFEGVISLC